MLTTHKSAIDRSIYLTILWLKRSLKYNNCPINIRQNVNISNTVLANRHASLRHWELVSSDTADLALVNSNGLPKEGTSGNGRRGKRLWIQTYWYENCMQHGHQCTCDVHTAAGITKNRQPQFQQLSNCIFLVLLFWTSCQATVAAAWPASNQPAVLTQLSTVSDSNWCVAGFPLFFFFSCFLRFCPHCSVLPVRRNCTLIMCHSLTASTHPNVSLTMGATR